jgi:hypothetical protein
MPKNKLRRYLYSKDHIRAKNLPNNSRPYSALFGTRSRARKFDNTERRSRTVSTNSSYSEGSGFESSTKIGYLSVSVTFDSYTTKLDHVRFHCGEYEDERTFWDIQACRIYSCCRPTFRRCVLHSSSGR